MGNELQSIREEIKMVESQILNHITSLIIQAAPLIYQGGSAVARLDVLFAKAAFGNVTAGSVPYVGGSGVINVKKFKHPVLASKKERINTVPIDLLISDKESGRSLIISGPNGGGKTLAMKSFGMVALMNKLSIPIPNNSLDATPLDPMRIDFFQDVVVELGDDQNVAHGESTYLARLNALARVLEKVNPNFSKTPAGHVLILLDELGAGTDPEAGSCIAQAVLEKILESDMSRTVSTTHSTQLKALAFTNCRFGTASVLLQPGEDAGYKLPAYKLCYGTIGNSYALDAASRSTPSLPSDVLDRANSLLAGGQDASDEYALAIITALEREKAAASIAAAAAKDYRKQSGQVRDAMILLARAYDEQFYRLEARLDGLFDELSSNATKNTHDLVGESLATLQLVRKKVKTDEQILRDKGLKIVTDCDSLKKGDSVVIIAEGELDGQIATITGFRVDANGYEKVTVVLNSEWGADPELETTMAFSIQDIALWDYPDYDEQEAGLRIERVKSIPDSRNRLNAALASIIHAPNSPTRQVKGEKEGANIDSGKQFYSSRDRKAARKKKNKK